MSGSRGLGGRVESSCDVTGGGYTAGCVSGGTQAHRQTFEGPSACVRPPPVTVLPREGRRRDRCTQERRQSCPAIADGHIQLQQVSAAPSEVLAHSCVMCFVFHLESVLVWLEQIAGVGPMRRTDSVTYGMLLHALGPGLEGTGREQELASWILLIENSERVDQSLHVQVHIELGTEVREQRQPFPGGSFDKLTGAASALVEGSEAELTSCHGDRARARLPKADAENPGPSPIQASWKPSHGRSVRRAEQTKECSA